MFEATLQPAGAGAAAVRLRKAAPLAVLAHATLFSAAVGVTIAKWEDVPEPDFRIVGEVPFQPDPAPPEGGGGATKVDVVIQKPVPTEAPRQVVQPPAVVPPTTEPEPVAAPQAEAATPPTGEEGTGIGEKEGVPWGIRGATGPLDSLGTDPNAISSGPPTSDTIADVRTANLLLPVIVDRNEPEYPELARRLHKEGTVVLEAVIGRDGAVESVRVLREVFPPLDQEAVRAVSRWRYRPATIDGRAVRCYLSVTVTFRLHSS